MNTYVVTWQTVVQGDDDDEAIDESRQLINNRHFEPVEVETVEEGLPDREEEPMNTEERKAVKITAVVVFLIVVAICAAITVPNVGAFLGFGVLMVVTFAMIAAIVYGIYDTALSILERRKNKE